MYRRHQPLRVVGNPNAGAGSNANDPSRPNERNQKETDYRLTRRKTASALDFRCQAAGRVAEPSCVRPAVQMLANHLVCGLVGIFGRDEPRVLLFATAPGAKLDLVYV